MKFDRALLQAAVRRACELDVKALKPGNVNVDVPAFGMTAADFFASADAIAEPITMPGLSIGERIYRAIEATREVVSCNTNLGIVLLFAPLIQAFESTSDIASLQWVLKNKLEELTIDDAEWAYRAIRLAKPGGMGTSAKHDIAKTPSVTLYQAMQEAVNHDQIAQLYVTGYRSLFERGLPVWRNAMARHGSSDWATTAVFLNFLAAEPDSLITRKFGRARSEEVSLAAKPFCVALEKAREPEVIRSDLIAWDSALKSHGLNPGTTADMTVATIFLADLQDMR
jgi:triphosphoribosyl-dephospho-CoA synthase